MSLGRVSTFFDIYIERDIADGIARRRKGAQELIDDFVIKLRITRQLRTPEYNDLFGGDPTWTTESVGGMGEDGRTLVTKTSFRMLKHLLQSGRGARTQSYGALVGKTSRALQKVLCEGIRSIPIPFNTKTTT